LEIYVYFVTIRNRETNVGKRFITVLIIIALLLLVAPPLMGIAYESQIREQIASVPDNPTVDFGLVDYERGLYSSNGAFRIELSDAYIEQMRSALESTDPANPPTPEQQEWIDNLVELMSGELRFDLDVQHGPVSVADGVNLGLATVHAEMDSTTGKLAEIQEILGVPYLFQGDAQVGFDGSFAFQTQVPAMTRSEPEHSFEFSGLDYDGYFGRSDTSVKASGGTELLSIEFDGGQMSIEDIVLTTDTKILSGYLWSGNTSIDIGKIQISSPDSAAAANFDLTRLGFDADIGLNDTADKLTIAIIYRLAGISGLPDNDIADLKLGMRFRNIDRQAIEDYMLVAQDLGFADPNSLEQMLPELEAIGTKILRGSPGVDLSPFEFVLNGEPFTASLGVDFDGANLPADIDILNLGNDPGSLIAALSASGQVKGSESLARSLATNILRQQIAQGIPPDAEITAADIDAAAAQQASMMIDGMIQQGLIKRDGGQLDMDFSYADGQLFVNNVPIPLGQ
jgi:uncharacterized protein YdgA (DUF945 family)